MDPESSSGQAPGSRQPSVASSEDTSKVGSRRWGVGCRFFRRSPPVRSWGSMPDTRLNFPTSHPLQPTSRRSQLSGPMPRHCSTVMSPRRQTSLLWGRVGVGVLGDAKAKSQSSLHGQPASHPLHPTYNISANNPPLAATPPSPPRGRFGVVQDRASLVLSGRIFPSPGEGRGGGCWRCKSQMSGADSSPPYTLHPTSYMPKKTPSRYLPATCSRGKPPFPCSAMRDRSASPKACGRLLAAGRFYNPLATSY